MSDEPPSRVQHLRNLTPDISQADIMVLCAPFGQVENVLMMRAKNQCLLMFQTLKASMDFTNHFASNFTQPEIRGRRIHAKYSRHQQITADSSRVSNVLLVSLKCSINPDEHKIPITTDVCWQIFAPYGTVEKLVIIRKQGIQCLVQMSKQTECATVYEYLQGKTVHVGSEPALEITLDMQFSQLPELVVKNPSLTAADYTINPSGGLIPNSAYPTFAAVPPPPFGYLPPPGYGVPPPPPPGYVPPSFGFPGFQPAYPPYLSQYPAADAAAQENGEEENRENTDNSTKGSNGDTHSEAEEAPP